MSGHRRRADGRLKVAYDSAAPAGAYVNASAGENAYLCRECDKWHVGHVKGSTFRSLLNRRLRRGVRA